MKITVLKKLDRNQLFEGNPPIDSDEEPVCPVFEEGQVFEVTPDGKMPEGFCTWAWNNIYLQAIHIMLDGRVVESGGSELAAELEKKGYEWVRERHEVKAEA